ncbi:hypothetical protein FOZ62_000687, partial [Perkinsus olseni]
MHAVGAILASAAIIVSGLDFSGIRLDGPGTPSPAGGEVDLSGINLEDPATASPVAPGLDWSGISLEDPSPTTVATELDWSSVSLESPASWADEKPSEQDTTKAEGMPTSEQNSTSCSQYPAALVGALLAVVLVGLLASIAQIWLLKKLLSRIPPREAVDLEQGN